MTARKATPRRPTKTAVRRAEPRPLSQRAWLRHLAVHVPIAVEGADPEGVHQIRVAAGRLAVWLEMGGRGVLRDDLRDLRRAAASVRDSDVLLLRDPPEAFAARLRERREVARPPMIERLRSPHVRALRQSIGLLPPISRRVAEASLPVFRDRVLRRGAALLRAERPSDEDFHRLRRAVRKLRYALDWLGRDTSQVKALQQTLGDLNDAVVELGLLEETGAAQELFAHARALRLRIASKRRSALVAWRDGAAAIEALR